MKNSNSKQDLSDTCAVSRVPRAFQLPIFFALLIATSNNELLAQYNGSFVNFQPVSGLEHPSGWDYVHDISEDGLTIGLSSTRSGSRSPSSWDIYVATRESVLDPFGAPVTIGGVNRAGVDDGDLTVTSDGLTAYFHSRSPTEESTRLGMWMSTREALDSDWGEPQFLTGSAGSAHPSLSSDDLTLYHSFSEGKGLDRDLYKMVRASLSEPFADPQPVEGTNTSHRSEASPHISSDELAIVYSDGNPSFSQSNIMIATRATKDEPFGEPVELDDFGLGSEVYGGLNWRPVISADWPAHGSKIYYTVSDNGLLGDWDIYEATWNVYVDGDANLDNDVNFADFLILSENFGQDGAWREGDFDGDGTVRFPDFLALSANFGNTAANGSAAAVPEPTAASLALFGLLGLIGFRKRR